MWIILAFIETKHADVIIVFKLVELQFKTRVTLDMEREAEHDRPPEPSWSDTDDHQGFC
ncbi:hypothetical protein ABHI18_012688 [Aspergillus niger]